MHYNLTGELNLTSSFELTCPAVQCFSIFHTTYCSLTKRLMAKFTTGIWSMNGPINFLANLNWYLNSPSHHVAHILASWDQEDHLAIDQLYLAIARLQTGCSQTPHTNDRFIVANALRNQMINATELTGTFKQMWESPNDKSVYSKPFTSA